MDTYARQKDWIGALIEELGKLADDIRKGKKYSESSAKSDTHSARLDTQLTDLLKQLEGQNF